MDDDVKEKVIAMNVNRPRTGLRDVTDTTSPADLLGRGTPLPRPDRGGDGQEAEPVQTEGEDPGGGPESFDPESTDYKAFGWAGNKTLPSLVIILKDGSECGINYADLGTAWPGGSMFLPSAPGCTGNVIRLRVAGDDGVFTVVIEGVRLRRVWELIMGHKTPWIHELPAGMVFVNGTDPVIRSVTFDRQRAAASSSR